MVGSGCVAPAEQHSLLVHLVIFILAIVMFGLVFD